jgi:two-component system sensor histidine kinase/response regulator
MPHCEMMRTVKTHVLFVDDDESNLIVWRAACADEFEVLTAGSADEALALLREHEVFVIFADQRMPYTSGVELLEKVRKEFPDTVRILITAYSDLAAAIDAINRGNVRRYLRKPCALPELRAEISEALDYYSLRARARAVERRLLLTERVYAMGLVASGFGRELARPATLIREAVTLAHNDLKAVTQKLEDDGADIRLVKSRLLELEEWLRRALEGVERVLDLARSVELRPDSGRVEAVDFADVLRLSLRIVRGNLRRGADIELDIRPTRPVRASPSKLSQVVLNLLVNALEGVASNAPSESVISIKLDEVDGMVRLDVKDNGPPIDEEEQANIFDPFHLPSSARGAGLGLAISKALIEEMAGRILVRSAEGRGATFSILLPVY